LIKAIDCFRHQTYPNKELVILFQDDDQETRQLIDSLTDRCIRSIEVKENEKLSLGAKRNLCASHSNGEYFCIWDDDDWYHADRLQVQMEAIQQHNREASVIVNIILYDATASQAYLSMLWPWEGTLLCKKSIFDQLQRYREINKGEDSFLLSDLVINNHIYPVNNPLLYIYVYNGQNTWDYNHFRTFFAKSQKLSPGISATIEKALDARCSPAEASGLLSDPDLFRDINYLHWAIPVFKRILQ
jgi:glycosyltransferase involved in cell wall biosynthesis